MPTHSSFKHLLAALPLVLSAGAWATSEEALQAALRVLLTPANGAPSSAPAAQAWPLSSQPASAPAPEPTMERVPGGRMLVRPAPAMTYRDSATPHSVRLSSGHRPTQSISRGMTLARLLARELRSTGLAKNVLFQAFVALNPQAFVKGNPNRLMAGATVQMFTDDDLQQLRSGRPLGESGARTSPEERRKWVHFP
jgi:Tfp pilus assembly protein FimV